MNKYELYNMLQDYLQEANDEYNLQQARWHSIYSEELKTLSQDMEYSRGLIAGISTLMNRLNEINGDEIEYEKLEPIKFCNSKPENMGFNSAREVYNLYQRIVMRAEQEEE